MTFYSNSLFRQADYWVSQNRKYCDFCKCWITDNKPSVDFHEKGRRHQANVKRRLNNITRTSTYAFKEQEKIDATVKQMERAALAAYRKDVANNADLTSISINESLEKNNLTLNEHTTNGENKKLWNEAKTKDGNLYYFNVMTNEKCWQPPKEGYLSIREQREQADLETMKQLKNADRCARKEALMRMQRVKKDENEERARLAREKLKERRVVDDIPEPVYGPLIEPGKIDPYGGWKVVTETKNIELDLPAQEEYYEIPIEFEPEPVVKEFKEKVVESLGSSSGGDVGFKKRKIGAGAKRNVRKRVDDD